MTQAKTPQLTRFNPLMEGATRALTGEGRGQAVGHWLGRAFGTRQLRSLGTSSGQIPWTPWRRPLEETTISLISTSGVHLQRDRPYDLYSDATFRVIPDWAQPDDLQITHRGYDRRDAARDINIVFPLPLLRELAVEGIVGRVAADHYGFGLTVEPEGLLASGREVGERLASAGVDLALLVPA